jgi:hypothetical protein
MKIRMRTGISGMRDGHSWPTRGEILDTDPREAAELIAQGHAEPVEDDAPAADPPAAPAPRRRRRAAETSGEATS